MKLLLSAIASDPFGQSEHAVGWKAAKLLARNHDVWVITHSICKPGVEKAYSEGLVPPRLHFIFHGEPFRWIENRQLARLQGWMAYVRWSRSLVSRAAAEHARIGFDLSHHVTYSSWRVASPLWQLNIPLIWGPVGGTSRFPMRLLPWLSRTSAAFEITREIAHFAGILSPSLRRCCRNAAAVVGSNKEASQLLARLRGSRDGVHAIYPVLFTPDSVASFQISPTEWKQAGPLQLFSGGFTIGSKGFAFALHALAQLRREGLDFHYVIAGIGPEIPHLRRLTAQLGLQENVSFSDGFSGAAYTDQLKRAHIILQPSFRENVGITMLEGMLASAVPIVLAASAPGEIVGEDVGFAIRVGSGREIVQGLAQAIRQVDRDRALGQRLGHAASQMVQREFSEERYLQEIESLYSKVIEEKLQRPSS